MADEGDIGAEIAQIEGLMQDNKSSYWRDTGMQERYRGLVEARDSGGPVPAAPSANEARKAELEKMMANTKGPYWSGRDAARLQDEYRGILEAGEAPGAVQIAGEGFRPDDVAYWQETYGVDGETLAAGTESVRAFEADLAADLGPDVAGDLQDAFTASVDLPVRHAVEAEFFEPLAHVEPYSQEGLAEYAKTETGRYLVAFIGAEAPAALARIDARLQRIAERAGPDGWKALAGWLNGLPANERAAILMRAAA